MNEEKIVITPPSNRPQGKSSALCEVRYSDGRVLKFEAEEWSLEFDYFYESDPRTAGVVYPGTIERMTLELFDPETTRLVES